jgi:hypothetical protein
VFGSCHSSALIYPLTAAVALLLLLLLLLCRHLQPDHAA